MEANIVAIVWWRIHRQSLLKWTKSEQMTIQKFNNDCWATNYKENKYYPYKLARCQCCQETQEKEDHILQCCKRTTDKSGSDTRDAPPAGVSIGTTHLEE
jgi:hypothetical protein